MPYKTEIQKDNKHRWTEKAEMVPNTTPWGYQPHGNKVYVSERGMH